MAAAWQLARCMFLPRLSHTPVGGVLSRMRAALGLKPLDLGPPKAAAPREADEKARQQREQQEKDAKARELAERVAKCVRGSRWRACLVCIFCTF